MSERRLTMHNGRTHKGGKTFSSKHNDHTQKNGAWDKDKAGENWLWQSNAAKGKTFDEGEKKFYEKYLRKYLDKQNERHKKSRHLERVKSMDQFRENKSYCPEETLLYFGDKENQIKKELMKEVLQEFFNWHKKEYPLAKILNMALHGDEKGADHLHIRKVWMAKDDDGDWIIYQNKSLEQMGVQRPNLEEPTSPKNNAKMTYTKACRDKLFELAKSKGIELVEEPRPRKESGKSRTEFIEDKLAKKEQELEEQIQELKAANEKDVVEFEEKKAILGDLKQDLVKSMTQEFKGDLGGKLKATSVVRECINRALEKLGLIKARVDKRTQLIQKQEPTYKMELELEEIDDIEL